MCSAIRSLSHYLGTLITKQGYVPRQLLTAIVIGIPDANFVAVEEECDARRFKFTN